MENVIDIIENPVPETWEELLQRPVFRPEELIDKVGGIFEQVQAKGDEALRKFTNEFDNVDIADFRVSEAELEKASEQISEELKAAMQLAQTNIKKFHASQQGNSKKIETSPGVWCWQEKRPIEKIGLYIPGGTAPLFSTVLMLAVPARLAGCKEIVICTPPAKNGEVSPAILYAAHLCGVSKVFKVGGVQAIAALTLGTGTVPKVYKIFGPGNQYVTAAKQMALQKGVAIDMPAGPSELLVIADHTADPKYVAADLLSQAEHGEDSQVILVSDSRPLLGQVGQELHKQLEDLPRKSIASAALQHCKFIYMSSPEQMLQLVNNYGPEHLIINAEAKEFYSRGIQNAGSVFLGPYSPESAGDYASGTNHTLPTGGFAKQYSGVNLDSFQKAISFQEISKDGLQEIGAAIETMAAAEGLTAHKRAVSIRINDKK